MRGVRGVVCSIIALFGLGVAAVPAGASAAEVNYVALGDSYSSGAGAGDYGDSGGCKRSANAHPKLWADANEVASFQFAACLGAKTSDVADEQLGALNADTSMVTISVGGNDAGFTDVFVTCTTSSDQGCQDRIDTAKAFVRDELPARLDDLYGEIARRAPDAEVVVLGYPRIYQLEGSCDAGLSEVKRKAINSGADVLAEVTAERASAAGFKFADVRQIFEGHGICSDDWWLKSLSWPVDESYHPNRDGQAKGYLAALNSVVGSSVLAG